MPVSEIVIDPAFSGIRKDSTGFFIWRIEDFEVVAVPKEHYGKFYKGDSYIVYSAGERSHISYSTEKPRVCLGTPEIHIHFWVGSQTSLDEAGIAAIKTVELDLFLGGTPIQHRETEGKESQRFLTYFKHGIRYLDGGVSTGFHHFKPNHTPHLYLVKGHKTVIVHQLPQVSWQLMNAGDVFVLDCHPMIYVWTGRYSNVHEKLQAAKFAMALKSEKNHTTIVILEDGQENALTLQEKQFFDQNLPVDRKQMSEINSLPQDDLYVRKVSSQMKLYKCSDENGTLKVIEIKTGPFLQSDLQSQHSYILDNGASGIWAWVGRRASRQDREEALRNAQGFITKKGYPHSTQVTRIVDGGEPADFRVLFKEWRDKDQTTGYLPRKVAKKISATVQTKFDVTTLHQQPQIAAQTQMVDGGDGQKEIWRVQNFDLVEVPPAAYGDFYSGDCYVILYTYQAENQKFIIYYWIGSQASQDEQGTAALKTIELDDKLEGRAVQVRVCQGKEPPHFMALFKGKMIVYRGGLASSFDGPGAVDVSKKQRYMIQVRGTSIYNTRAVEVNFEAASLNSRDCFIIVIPVQILVWCGRSSTGDEREVAKALAASRGEPILISEGSERENFWEILGGKTEYSKDLQSHDNTTNNEARLFHCSNLSGVFRAEAILDFDQQDLIEADVMLLDAWNTIFIWIGKHSNLQERTECEALAFEYLKTDPAQRDLDTPIYRIKQGYEPPNFTGYFGAWNINASDVSQDIVARLGSIAPDAIIYLATQETSANGSSPKRTLPMTSLEGLEVPEGVDPTRKEEYLCDNDFESFFHMNRQDFNQLPPWRRLNLKKNVGLF